MLSEGLKNIDDASVIIGIVEREQPESLDVLLQVSEEGFSTSARVFLLEYCKVTFGFAETEDYLAKHSGDRRLRWASHYFRMKKKWAFEPDEKAGKLISAICDGSEADVREAVDEGGSIMTSDMLFVTLPLSNLSDETLRYIFVNAMSLPVRCLAELALCEEIHKDLNSGLYSALCNMSTILIDVLIKVKEVRPVRRFICMTPVGRMGRKRKSSYVPMSFSDRVAELAVERGIALGDGAITNVAALEKHWEKVDFELKFEITERCDLNCSFCHQEFGKKTKRGRDFPFDAYRGVIDAAETESQIKNIRITGGEPTLHPKHKDFLQYAVDAGFHTILNTNAAHLTPEKIEELAPYVGTWKVSLPAADEAGVDVVTGVPGTWHEKIAALETLHKQKCNVDLLIVMTPQNIDDIPMFIALAEKYGATYSFLRQESSASNRRPLAGEHIEKLLSALEASRSYLGLALPFCATGDMEKVAALADGRIGCGPYSSLVVKADETVHHCYSRRVSRPQNGTFLATAVRMAAEDFIDLPEPCRECAYGAVCLGGCRCGFALRNSPVGPIDYLADLEHIQIYPSGEQG